MERASICMLPLYAYKKKLQTKRKELETGTVFLCTSTTYPRFQQQLQLPVTTFLSIKLIYSKHILKKGFVQQHGLIFGLFRKHTHQIYVLAGHKLWVVLCSFAWTSGVHLHSLPSLPMWLTAGLPSSCHRKGCCQSPVLTPKARHVLTTWTNGST